MIKKIIILALLLYPVNLIPGQNEIGISKCSVSEISVTDFSLNYSVTNSFGVENYSNLQVILPFEKYIIQGSIESRVLNETDFLFSQFNIDLNSDSDFIDSFKVKSANNTFYINNIKISPLFKTTANYQAMIPFDTTGNFNQNRITKNGKPFTLRNFSSSLQEITIGFNMADEIDYRKFPNSQLFIEVITSDESAAETLLIDGQKPFFGETNELLLTGGEKFYRFSAAKTIEINNNTSDGKLKIEKIKKPFQLRITYYFTISENLILVSQKTVKVD